MKTAQTKQQEDCNNRYNNLSSTSNIGYKVLLKNQKFKDGKDAKFNCEWISQYTIQLLPKLVFVLTLINKIRLYTGNTIVEKE